MVIYKLSKGLIIYLFFICNATISKRMSSPDSSKTNLDKLNECQRCKVLTDSFNNWLEKTSRGKYEGGDAAWEEAKLKSYARSEIRLVEIQEGLCSELKKHKDYCYSLAEEVEQVLEKWWFNEDPNSVELYSWLCIESLQYCCPNNHFGDNCSPCPIDINNRVCGGHGRCDGDGTRKGNGTCICKKGYAGKMCKDCANNYFSVNNDICMPCDKSCEGCSGEGAGACVACKIGWQLHSGVCVDLNECLDINSCKPNQFCINKEGSYLCKECDILCKTCVGSGYTNCTSCEAHHVLWSGRCLDDKLKSNLLQSTLKRIALYIGLFVITIFILKNSKSLASLVILIIAMYIYYAEKNSEMNLLDILLNLYLN